MSHESDGNLVPRAPRFKIADPSNAVVKIIRTEESGRPELSAKLVDISQHGTKLQVPVNLRFEEALHLSIEVLDTNLEYQGVASVRHIRALEDEGWLVGCAIAPPLPDETFSYLATAAGKERRRFRRLPIAAEATIRRQTEAKGSAATLHNLSSGGFCFSSEVHYKSGELVQMSIKGTDGEPRVIEASICWQIDGPDGCIAGCQFSSRDSYAEVCACLTEQPSLNPMQIRKRESTSKLVLVAAVLAMFLPPMITLLTQTNNVSAEVYPSQLSPQIASHDKAALRNNNPEDNSTTTDSLLAELTEDIPQPMEKAVELIPTSEETLEVELPQLREWVDNTGKFRTRATFVEATSEHIILRKTNGSQTKVPLQRLSDADREYVNDRRSR